MPSDILVPSNSLGTFLPPQHFFHGCGYSPKPYIPPPPPCAQIYNFEPGTNENPSAKFGHLPKINTLLPNKTYHHHSISDNYHQKTWIGVHGDNPWWQGQLWTATTTTTLTPPLLLPPPQGEENDNNKKNQWKWWYQQKNDLKRYGKINGKNINRHWINKHNQKRWWKEYWRRKIKQWQKRKRGANIITSKRNGESVSDGYGKSYGHEKK